MVQVLNEYLFPLLSPSSVAAAAPTDSKTNSAPPAITATAASPIPIPLSIAEIGIGGGRIASRLLTAYQPARFVGFDISEQMLKRAKTAVAEVISSCHPPLTGPAPTSGVHVGCAELVLLSTTPAKSGGGGIASAAPSIPQRFTAGSFDVIYSFDVFPHIDLHTQYGYLLQFKRLLKPVTGRIFLHVANIESDRGFDRFAAQSKYTAAGFYFMNCEMVTSLAMRAGFRVVKQSDPRPPPTEKNGYYARDFLFVLEHAPATAAATSSIATAATTTATAATAITK